MIIWRVPDENTFSLFGIQHITALLITTLIILAVFAFKKRLRAGRHERIYRYLMAFLMIAGLMTEQIWTVAHGMWTFKMSLPISLCTLTEIVAVYMLISKSYSAFGFVYFGMVGVTQALLTPSLSYGFPGISYICYFIKHGLLIIAPLYMVAVHQYRPTHKQLWKFILAVIGILPFIFLINWAVGGNYWYISEKTPDVSVLTYLGSYPWFLLSILGIAIALCYVYYLPFRIMKRRRRAKF